MIKIREDYECIPALEKHILRVSQGGDCPSKRKMSRISINFSCLSTGSVRLKASRENKLAKYHAPWSF